jgi:ATP phosphoribosyltransferase regulatory subunit
MSFSLLAEGPGEPVGLGGRYDRLLGRYGMDQPATGFAFDLENLQWALQHAGHTLHSESTDLRIVTNGAAKLAKEIAALRASNVVVATVPEATPTEACLAFARAWRYDAVLLAGPSRKRGADGSAPNRLAAVGLGRARVVRVTDGTERTVTDADIAETSALAAWARNREED